MKHKKLLALLGAICLVVILVALPLMTACAPKEEAPPPGPAKPAPIKIKALSTFAEYVMLTKFLHQFIDKVTARAGGELEIEYMGGPEVIPSSEAAEALKSGTIDLTIAIHQHYKALVPGMGAISLTPWTPEEERVTGLYDFWVEHHKEHLNVMYLGKAQYGQSFSIWLNEPVQKLEDLKGLSMFGIGDLGPGLKALGAVPKPMGFGDIFTSLQAGTIDGIPTVPSTIDALKVYEVSKYRIEAPHKQTASSIMVNLDTWNSLPKHLQELLQDTAMAMETISWVVTENLMSEWQAKREAAGEKVITFSAGETEKLTSAFIDAGWEDVKKEVTPELYNKLRELNTKTFKHW